MRNSPAQRHARLERVMAADHQEVEEVRDQEDREHQQRERGRVQRHVPGLELPREQQAADQREGGEGREVGDEERERVAGAEVIEEHGGDADRGRRRRAQQRGGQHEREERARDPLAAEADGEQIARQRQHEQHQDQRHGLPVGLRRAERGDRDGGDQHDRLDDDQSCCPCEHRVQVWRRRRSSAHQSSTTTRGSRKLAPVASSKRRNRWRSVLACTCSVRAVSSIFIPRSR